LPAKRAGRTDGGAMNEEIVNQIAAVNEAAVKKQFES